MQGKIPRGIEKEESGQGDTRKDGMIPTHVLLDRGKGGKEKLRKDDISWHYISDCTRGCSKAP